jgi:hypothetical protein
MVVALADVLAQVVEQQVVRVNHELPALPLLDPGVSDRRFVAVSGTA